MSLEQQLETGDEWGCEGHLPPQNVEMAPPFARPMMALALLALAALLAGPAFAARSLIPAKAHKVVDKDPKTDAFIEAGVETRWGLMAGPLQPVDAIYRGGSCRDPSPWGRATAG